MDVYLQQVVRLSIEIKVRRVGAACEDDLPVLIGARRRFKHARY